MKYAISLLLFSCIGSASTIQIYHEDSPHRAQWVKDIFFESYQIPEDLLVIKETLLCEAIKQKGRLDLCIKKNGDLQVVSVDRRFINESLKIFWAP